MLVLSTAHLSQHTCQTWLALAEHGHRGSIPVWAKGDYGWFIYIVDDLDPGSLPDDLAACWRLAVEHKLPWIMFDRDAPAIEELPTYEW
jgi:hypothetical protein